jgi:hypothetical protein
MINQRSASKQNVYSKGIHMNRPPILIVGRIGNKLVSKGSTPVVSNLFIPEYFALNARCPCDMAVS